MSSLTTAKGNESPEPKVTDKVGQYHGKSTTNRSTNFNSFFRSSYDMNFNTNSNNSKIRSSSEIPTHANVQAF